MEHGTEVLVGLLVAFVAALVGGDIAQRLRVPTVVGQIVSGVLVGSSVLNWLKISAPLELLSELGAILLLFSVGLETNIKDLRKVGKSAFMVGVLGVVVPFALGASWAYASGYASAKAMFIAAAFVATSAGVIALLGIVGSFGIRPSGFLNQRKAPVQLRRSPVFRNGSFDLPKGVVGVGLRRRVRQSIAGKGRRVACKAHGPILHTGGRSGNNERGNKAKHG